MILKLVLVPRPTADLPAQDRKSLEAEGAELSDYSLDWNARLLGEGGEVKRHYPFVSDERLKYHCPSGTIWMRRDLKPESPALAITWRGPEDGLLQPDGKIVCSKEVEFEIRERDGKVEEGKGTCESKWRRTPKADEAAKAAPEGQPQRQ